MMYSIRWFSAKQGFEWQYWNNRERHPRYRHYTREHLMETEAVERIAKYVYGCEPKDIFVVSSNFFR